MNEWVFWPAPRSCWPRGRHCCCTALCACHAGRSGSHRPPAGWKTCRQATLDSQASKEKKNRKMKLQIERFTAQFIITVKAQRKKYFFLWSLQDSWKIKNLILIKNVLKKVEKIKHYMKNLINTIITVTIIRTVALASKRNKVSLNC